MEAMLRAVRPLSAPRVLLSARFKATLVASARSIRLNTLQDNPGTRRPRIRVGRGPASGKGKTSGRGHGGQKARAGNTKPRLGFEGGQTPLFVRIPKRGFANAEFTRTFTPLNLARLQHWINEKRIDASKPINMKTLIDSGCVTEINDGIKILGDGSELFTAKINIEISKASARAISRIEELGGSVTAMYYNRLGLRALLHPEKFTTLPKHAAPIKAKDIAFYSKAENRGYLAKAE